MVDTYTLLIQPTDRVRKNYVSHKNNKVSHLRALFLAYGHKLAVLEKFTKFLITLHTQPKIA
ncbi:hypothetical protein, partial [Vibrio coralliilyticus]|uniref:hypothetical protein n=1 Tax=Vibrio coralliilyticus TaxID=190893 RepID=UPI001C25E576